MGKNNLHILNNHIYNKLIENVAQSPLLLKLKGKTIFITGATGMICSCFIDVIMKYNSNSDEKCKIIALGRNDSYAQERFKFYWDKEYFQFIIQDVSKPFEYVSQNIDFFIHAASSTHPRAYANEPINTIFSNVYGIDNLLKIVTGNKDSRLLFLSSVEIYGENKGDVTYFDEDYLGYINCNTLRAGYPEAKRLCEAICQAYIKEKNIDAVILRLPRSFGPTIKMDDSRAISQFIFRGIENKDIIVKSEGNQEFSYGFVIDEIYGILYAMLYGICGEAYNLSDQEFDIKLKDLATLIASICGTNVQYDLPDENEKLGASTVTKSMMNSYKLKSLGWNPQFTIEGSIKKTIEILLETRGDR